MRELFARQQAGRALSARLLNTHRGVASRVCRQSHSGVSGISGSFAGTANDPQHHQQQLIVTEDLGDDLYRVKVRNYAAAGGWQTSDSLGTFLMDASETTMSFSEDDKLTGYWHTQRGAYLPISTKPDETQPPVVDVSSSVKQNVLYMPIWYRYNPGQSNHGQKYEIKDVTDTSCELLENYTRADGKKYADAVYLAFRYLTGPDIGVRLDYQTPDRNIIFTQPGTYIISFQAFMLGLFSPSSNNYFEGEKVYYQARAAGRFWDGGQQPDYQQKLLASYLMETELYGEGTGPAYTDPFNFIWLVDTTYGFQSEYNYQASSFISFNSLKPYGTSGDPPEEQYGHIRVEIDWLPDWTYDDTDLSSYNIYTPTPQDEFGVQIVRPIATITKISDEAMVL